MVLGPLNENRVRQIRKSLEEKFERPLSEKELAECMPGIPVRRTGVIELTKLKGTIFVLNADLIETLESTPDTVITLVTGRKYIVRDTVEEVREKCISYKREINTNR